MVHNMRFNIDEIVVMTNDECIVINTVCISMFNKLNILIIFS